MPEPRVPPTYPALTTPHPSPTPALPSTSHYHTLSVDTHATQTTLHASQSQQPPHPHRVPRQPHRQTKDNMTTYTTQGHRPSSKSERNLITLQVHINGIKTNSRSSNCLFTTQMQISSQFRKQSSTLKQIHNFTTVRADRLHKAGGGLVTTLHSLQHTYIRPSIHTTQNFKWSRYTLTTLNMSQLQTFIYLLEIAHSRTTQQRTRTYNTAYSTSQTYHTQSSPEM